MTRPTPMTRLPKRPVALAANPANPNAGADMGETHGHSH